MSGEEMLQIDAELKNLGLVARFIEEAAGRLRADSQAALDMTQAVDEVVTNVIMHGYRGSPGTIEIELGRDGECLIARVRDHAPPFDPTRVVPRPQSKRLEDRRAGGLGMPLVRAFCQEVSYRTLPEGGNELTLTTRIAE